MALNILITGGFGFIGGRLSTYLKELGQNIIVGTRNTNSKPFSLKKINEKKVIWDDLTSLKKLCQGIDVIIHTAGMNSQDCANDPVAALEFNGVATTRLVSAALCSGVKKFIYLSTAHVYSSPLVGIISEKSYPKNFHPYATSHLAGEMAVIKAYKEKKIQGIVLRISNAFGVPSDHRINCWNLLVNDLCKQAVINKELCLKSDGNQLRDFIPLSELCQIIRTFITDLSINKELGVFNIGTGKTKSVIQMAKVIQNRCEKILEFRPKLIFKKKFEEHNPSTFKYITNRLNKIGYHHNNRNSIKEIDKLLQFCDLTYGIDRAKKE